MFHQFRANFIELYQEFINRRAYLGICTIPILLMGIVMIAVNEYLFSSFRSTVIGFFTVSIALIWIGIFNSITTICSIRAKIKVQYIQGMKISSFVGANVVFQFLQSCVQAIIVGIVYMLMGIVLCEGFQKTGMCLPIWIEITFVMLIAIFSASMLGMVISAFSKDSITAMTIMPMFLVIEMVFSNALFRLPDFGNNILGKITDYNICKWTTSLLGTISNVESMSDYYISQAPDIVYTYSMDNVFRGVFYIVLHTLVCIILTQIRLSQLKKERVFN